MGERMNRFASTVVFVFAFVKNGDGVAFCNVSILVGLVGGGGVVEGERGRRGRRIFFFFFINNNNVVQ